MTRPRWTLLDVEFSPAQALLTLIGVPVALAAGWLVYVVLWAVYAPSP